MKKLLFVLTLFAFSCGDGSRNDNTTTSDESNEQENVDENSRENISPQLEDSAGRLNVDTVSSAGEIRKEQQTDEDGDNK